jgi:hypothetical protein
MFKFPGILERIIVEVIITIGSMLRRKKKKGGKV